MSRWKAALIHLSISFVVAATATALLLGVWYPPPYFHASGAGRLLLLVTGADVVLGPLLTLIIFRSGKPGLKFDLWAIGTLQAIALAYGFGVMLQSRPVFMVAAVDRFALVAANQISASDLAEAPRASWRHLSWTGPVLVGTKLPSDAPSRNKLLFSALDGKDVERMPKYYVPYAQAAQQLLHYARPLTLLCNMHPAQKAEIRKWLQRHRMPGNQVMWLPIVARDADLTMLMDGRNGKPLGALPLNPWQADTPHTNVIAAAGCKP